METISFNTDQLRSQFNNAIARIRKLEEENLTLSHMNDMYQEELSQKTEALQKSTHDYATLKAQYEELLTRVTELHIENQSIHSSSQSSQTSTPLSQNQLTPNFAERVERDEDLILSLREKIEKLTKKKINYKMQLNDSRLRISQLENTVKQIKSNKNEIWNSTFATFREMVSPYLNNLNFSTVNANSNQEYTSFTYSYLLEATNSLIRQLKISSTNNNNDIYKQKYQKLKLKYKKVLDKCQMLAQNVANNQTLLDNAIAEQGKRRQKCRLDEEINRMHHYLVNYEKQCNNLKKSTDSSKH